MVRAMLRGLALALACALGGACESTPDPRTVEGALAMMAQAAEEDDAAKLFRVVDERSRHAMASIVNDRREAAGIVRERYPEELREGALRELGDGADVADAAALFAARCDTACRRALTDPVAAPRRTETQGEELVVHTAKDTTVHLYRSDPARWWGLVWRLDELDRERADANRDLEVIRRNGETYARRARLEGAAP